MKTKLWLFLAAFALVFSACDKEAELNNSLKGGDGAFALLGGNCELQFVDGVAVTDLIAGQDFDNPVGTVTVKFDGDDIVVTYKITRDGWLITETHLHIASKAGLIPTGGGGNPQIGQFDYTDGDLEQTEATYTKVTYTVPKSAIDNDNDNDCYYIAAHAVVVGESEGEGGVVDLVAFNAQFPVGPVEATIQKSRSQSTTAYFEDVKISGGTFLDGIYAEAWCAEDGVVRTLQGNPIAYSTYDLPEGIVNNPENLNKVNWILNHIWHGLDAGDGLGLYTMGDIQMAIWKLIDEENQPPVFSDTAKPFSDDRIDKIIDMAEENFVPGCGEKIAIVLVYENHQNLFITYSLPCYQKETAWGEGCPFTLRGGSWAMYFKVCDK